VLTGRPQQCIGVADLGDNLESRVGKETGDSFPHQDGIVGEDQPQSHGRSTNARMAAPEICSLGMNPK
jgi:hypothetical protein